MLAALSARWDAQRETFTPRQADAAPEMAAAPLALPLGTILYSLRP
jgi:hypothetical protein